MPRVPGGKPSPRERNRINPQRRFDFEAGEVRWFDEVLAQPPLSEYWRDLYAQQVQAYVQMGPTYSMLQRAEEPMFRAQGPTVAGEPITIERMRRGAARSMRGTVTGRHVQPPDIQRLGPYEVHYAPRGGRVVARLEQREREIRQRQEEQMLREERERQERAQAAQARDRAERFSHGFSSHIYFVNPDEWT